MADRNGGAFISVVTTKPSLDIASLMQLALDNMAPDGDQGWLAKPFVAMNQSKDPSDPRTAITVSPSAVIHRMLKDPGFERVLDEQQGFMRDVKRPARNEALKIGGRLVPDTGGKLKAALHGISEIVAETLKARQAEIRAAGRRVASPFGDSANLVATACANINGAGLGTRISPPGEVSYSIAASAFGRAEATGSRGEVARHMTSFEEVAPGRRIDQFLSAIRTYFVDYRGGDPDEVDDEVAQWREQAQSPKSQLARFGFMLADESLSRVRFSVGLAIMEALAGAADVAKPGQADLVRHVSRVRDLYMAVVERQDADPRLDLKRLFGVDGSLSSDLVNATFWKILPAWPSAEAQLFEDANEDPADYGVRREVGYGFKVNGWAPREGCFAYEARVTGAADDIAHSVDPDNERRGLMVGRRLAELVVLDAVVPGGRWEALTPVEAVEACVAAISGHSDALAAVEELRQRLMERAGRMIGVADGMIAILKGRAGRDAISRAVRQPMQYYVNVGASVLNKSAVASGCASPLTQPTADDAGEDDRIGWLKAIRITSVQSMSGPGHLFSFGIRIKIADKALRVIENRTTGGRTRRLTDGGKAALVVWTPLTMVDGKATPPGGKMVGAWRNSVPTVVDVTYDRNLLSFGDKADERSQRRAAAIRTAFAMLVLVGLESVLGKSARALARSADGSWTPWQGRICMMRLQELSARNARWNTADSAMYAISQAVEHVLGRDLPVRLQGLNLAWDNSFRYRASKSFDALLSGFDYSMTLPVACGPEKVGVINFTSRPCDAGTELPSGVRVVDPDTMHVVLGRAYLADRNGTNLVLRRLPNIHSVRPLDDALSAPPAICEAVRRLRELGCVHVVMIGHKFSGRSMGRSALRHSHHENRAFLSSLAERFGDVRFYPMVRDSMRVVRTDDRLASAFEVLGLEDHKGRFVDPDVGEIVFRHGGLAPVYSLATMKHVSTGAEQGHRPQSSITLYYLHASIGLEDVEGLRRGKVDMLTDTPERHAVAAALRAIHYAEAEGVDHRMAQPVVDAAKWMDVNTIEAAGEMQVLDRSRRARGRVELNLVAVLSAVADAMDVANAL